MIFFPEIKFSFHILIDLMMNFLWAMVFVNLLVLISTQVEDSDRRTTKRLVTLSTDDHGTVRLVPDFGPGILGQHFDCN